MIIINSHGLTIHRITPAFTHTHFGNGNQCGLTYRIKYNYNGFLWRDSTGEHLQSWTIKMFTIF